ncbi:MAG: hypothetical protein WBC05_21430 [Sedimentisphaerales bacterium]
MANMAVSLLGFSVVVLLAIYWTLWKVRGELNESWEKLISELSEIRKSLEKKAGST